MSRAEHFLSCDWGTSRFRLRWVARGSHRVLATVENGEGAKVLYSRWVESGRVGDAEGRASTFEQVLVQAIAELRRRTADSGSMADAPVIISGMASSTVGWRELPYAATPFGLDGSGLRVETMGRVMDGDDGHEVWLVSGLATGTDMMRGEETELMGVLLAPELAGAREDSVVVLPGTHSKQVRVERERVVDFRTYMTGELMELLSTRSLLGASVQWPPGPWMADAFREGLEWADTAGLARGLFRVRTRSVLGGVGKEENAWFLAGLVVGAEVGELRGWPGTGGVPIVLAAGSQFASTYRWALEWAGVGSRVTVVDPEELPRATLRAHARVLDRLGR